MNKVKHYVPSLSGLCCRVCYPSRHHYPRAALIIDVLPDLQGYVKLRCFDACTMERHVPFSSVDFEYYLLIARLRGNVASVHNGCIK